MTDHEIAALAREYAESISTTDNNNQYPKEPI